MGGVWAWPSSGVRLVLARGQKVLVTGIGGGVASFALLWAKYLGAEVYVTSGSEEKLEQAKALGALGGVNYRQDGWGKSLRELCGGFDLVIDSAGGAVVNTALNASQCASHRSLTWT